jgi:hypothetical protein
LSSAPFSDQTLSNTEPARSAKVWPVFSFTAILPVKACPSLNGDVDVRGREQLNQPGEVGERAGQPIDLIDDDHIDPSGLHVG